MKIDPSAGKPATLSMLVDVPRLISAYYTMIPETSIPEQKVVFGTSGHRGSSLDHTFNERHILAISQAICQYRLLHNIDGPLFLGMDTHALSYPAYISAIEVFAANQVYVKIAAKSEFTPTPVISHAIIGYNKQRKKGWADGVVITPSHNPPEDGGFKYNTPNGGPSSTIVSNWIQEKANEILQDNLKEVKRIPFEKALQSTFIQKHDYLNNYINDLGKVINMDLVRNSKIRIGVDPLGGAGVHYWDPIANRYGLDLTVVNHVVDPTFRFMTVDWDGQIRMDPSSSYAMQGLIKLKNEYDISFACDTDHDRHGIVTKSKGLLPPNHYLSVAISYLLGSRSEWNNSSQIGKTIVTTSMIDKIVFSFGRKLYEVPVGFKWFADGLWDGSLCFGAEESAGASFVRLDGSPWTTDKDGIVPSLLAAEITAVTGRDPGEIYNELTEEFGNIYYDRMEVTASAEERKLIGNLSPEQIPSKELAGDKITEIITKAPGNMQTIGGVKVITENGWFAARPSGTENIYKIYGESYKTQKHLGSILAEAQVIVNQALNK